MTWLAWPAQCRRVALVAFGAQGTDKSAELMGNVRYDLSWQSLTATSGGGTRCDRRKRMVPLRAMAGRPNDAGGRAPGMRANARTSWPRWRWSPRP